MSKAPVIPGFVCSFADGRKREWSEGKGFEA